MERKDKMPILVKPYKHQLDAYEFALRQIEQGNKCFALFAEMGTGKSLMTIAIAGTLYKKGLVKRMIVIAPLSIVNVWKDEFEKFANFDYNLCVLEGGINKKADTLRYLRGSGLQVAVINYESAWRLEDELFKFDADFIVCDESTKIKNPQAKCSKALHRLGKKSRYNAVLSGTPVVNNPIDLFSQYKFMDDKLFGGSFYAFRARYCVLGGFQSKQIIGYRNLEEMTEKAHKNAFRIKLRDAVDLPPVIDEIRKIKLEPKAYGIYVGIDKESYASLMDGEITTTNVLTRLMRLSQVTGGFVKSDGGDLFQQVSSAKLEALEDIVDICISENKKVVVFARFIPEIQAIERMLKAKKIEYSLIKGDVVDRANEVKKFQEDDNVKVFIGQLQTTSMGITLTKATVAVFYSLDFNYANYEQSRARIMRIGQTEKCLYIHLVVVATVDEDIMHALEHKADIASMIVDRYKKSKKEDSI